MVENYNSPSWAEDMNCAITVCDRNCNIIFMNKKSSEIFARHGSLIGKNLMDCHPEGARSIIRRLLETGESNSYTISKNGVRKMIYQTPWRNSEGAVAGLVEISMIIPENLPHYDRDAK